MASLRHIRSRIRSVQNSKQIMRAMQLVSASKLKRAQGKLAQGRDVMGFLDGLLQRVLAAAAAEAERSGTSLLTHPLCRRPDASHASGLVLFTSDAGLCGSYNANLIQMAESYLVRDSARTTKLIFLGKKGHRYFTRRGHQAAGAYLDLAGRPDLAKAEAIGRALVNEFLGGGLSAISVLYSRYVSSTLYRPTVEPWLPIQLEGVRPLKMTPYIFEPSPRRIFETLLPRWALARFQLVLLEAFTSEHSARMIAMKNATDNAQELLDALTIQRNKIRQAAITKELSEIVGTSEALK
ncbi:MAG: ATP synthase F1 subunit gamma [Candidatus Omnitrophica bacterium]|nr:ATP synthase F1 subunit gamma [Candidatus Omnitrophota bacterium]